VTADTTPRRTLAAIALVNLVFMLAVAAYGFLVPAGLLTRHLADPALGEPGVPRLAWQMHRRMSSAFEQWARDRVASGAGAKVVCKEDVPSTEWPVFSCVFYLLATENLQHEWARTHPADAPDAPAVYARGAIEAAASLVTDPAHHTWVRMYWGTNFWHKDDLFFRSLVIAALTRYEALTGDRRHHTLLTAQAAELSAELDRSEHGLLEDYPGECYPIDVVAAVAWLRDSDRVTGLDHTAFVERARRGFDGRLLDARGLVPFFVDLQTLQQEQPARGTGNSWVGAFAPHLWPETARRWYDLSERHFWQERLLAAGFREFPRGMPDKEWGFDIDSGPILAGFSPAANAFAVAAARANGRFDHAWPLSAQMLVASWPRPGGRLRGARLLSSPQHAPLLGEAAIAYFLTVQPASGVALKTGGELPGFVYVGVTLYSLTGLLFAFAAFASWRRWRKADSRRLPAPRTQAAVWLLLVAGAILAFGMGATPVALIAILLAQCIPRASRHTTA
jgi:hypothetical protein